jgi:hypothetical protein
VRRTGGTRRIAVVMTTAAAVLGMSLLAACGNPKTSVNRCQGASEEVMSAIQTKLTANGKLRNAKLVRPKASPYTFVSAEIHLDEDAAHDDGDIATWATKDIKSTDGFVSVDVHAREESKWPHASFKVTRDGAIESRACTGLNTGKTRAQIKCEQDQSSGENVQLPQGKDCSDL